MAEYPGIIVTPAELDEIRAQGEREYPNECCGVILARGGDRRLIRFTNLQDEMHGRDPNTYPRTSRNAYFVGKPDQDRMYALLGQGFDLAVIYHSHPDVDAYFSPTDILQAAPPPIHEAMWPTTTYVVVSVRKGRAVESAAFRWNPVDRHFDELHRQSLASTAPACS